jgi:hypothetical protein
VTTWVSEAALAGLAEIVEGGGDVDDVLRAAVDLLVGDPSISWAAVRFVEDGALVLGPSAGVPDETRRLTAPIRYRGDDVGELVVDGAADLAFLEQVAATIAPYVLLGWDTGGEDWEP